MSPRPARRQGKQSAWLPRALPANLPLYLGLADRIAEDIAAGRLAPGARLPTHRQLAAILDIDLTTVTRGYAEARRRGLLTGQVGRGTFVRPDAVVRGGDTFRSGGAVEDLSLNLPPRLDPDLPAIALADTLERLARAVHLDSLTLYQNNAGMEPHRMAGAGWVDLRVPGAAAERVVVTAGAQHAIVALLSSLARPGDLVVTEGLTYPGFLGAAEQLGLRVRGLPMDEEGIRMDALRAAFRQGARLLYTTPTLHNPSTITMSPARRTAIARAARQFGVPVIEDDVYGVLVGRAPDPLTIELPDLSYFIASLTKAVAGGLRIGYVLCPSEEATERVAAAIRVTTWMAPPLMAEVASDWIRTRTARQILQANREEARKRQDSASRILAPWSWRGGGSGYHGWLELPQGWSSADFVAQARRAGVAVTPADAFTAPGFPVPAAVRLCVGGSETLAALEQGLQKVAELLAVGPRASSHVM